MNFAFINVGSNVRCSRPCASRALCQESYLFLAGRAMPVRGQGADLPLTSAEILLASVWKLSLGL